MRVLAQHVAGVDAGHHGAALVVQVVVVLQRAVVVPGHGEAAQMGVAVDGVGQAHLGRVEDKARRVQTLGGGHVVLVRLRLDAVEGLDRRARRGSHHALVAVRHGRRPRMIVHLRRFLRLDAQGELLLVVLLDLSGLRRPRLGALSGSARLARGALHLLLEARVPHAGGVPIGDVQLVGNLVPVDLGQL